MKRVAAKPMRSDAEVATLVNENRRLVEYMVGRYLKRFTVGTMEREDLVSWGYIGLVQAAKAWDPARGHVFPTLACRAIERMIARGVNREWKPEKENRTYHLDDVKVLVDGESDRFIDFLSDESDLTEEVEKAWEIKECLDCLDALPSEMRQLLIARYLHDTSIEQIRCRMKTDITRQGVYSKLKIATRAANKIAAKRDLL